MEASFGYLDASLNQIFLGQASQDASIEVLRGDTITLDASIADINLYQSIQDASISLAIGGIAQLDSSIIRIDGILDSLDASIVDINLYQTIQDASILAIESSLGDYVRKDGDIMTGPLVITEGGLEVGSIGTPLDVSIYSNLYIHSNTTIGGTLRVDGSVYITNTETIDVSANFIHLNTGLTGVPSASMQSGIEIGRGDLEPYVFLFDESSQTFRIGIATDTSMGYLDSSTQAVATRQDNPIADGVAYWDDSESRFDTTAAFTYVPGLGLTIDGSLTLSSYGAVGEALIIGPAGVIESAIIPDVSGFATKDYVDGSLGLRDTSIAWLEDQIAQLDASVVNINLYQIVQDNSILANTNDITQIESSIGDINNTLISIDASIVDINSELISIDASITNINNDITQIESSIGIIDLSIDDLYTLDASNIKGAINVGDGSAQIFRDVSNNLLAFREIIGVGAVQVAENGDVIEISIDASFAGEVNTGSNIGSGTGVFSNKVGEDLEFKSLKLISHLR
ncbi:MAG: hypothetical protein HC831_15660 [Chloroflexia bacterium]|nr:hypothetical protein [Chloroflexia bacterium]